jgi:[ribosomal protein S5]-alanine N-acetyltransferase
MPVWSDILTDRLRLVVITPSLMMLETTTLSRLLGAEVPYLWPPEHWEPHVFDFMRRQQLEHPETAGWNRYVLLPREPSILIGTLGGFLRCSAEAEIGYSILRPWQRQGLAREGIHALIREVFRTVSVLSISAQTFPDLIASRRVLEKCGFHQAGFGDDQGTIRYCLERSGLPPLAVPC